MADTGPTTLSLFSGVGGLDIGWHLATGARVVGYCERDAYAASILLARMADEALEPAPVWCGDVCELPLAPFRGVDAIIGGFPCQDISTAGKGAGIDGERSGLWGRAFVPAIRELRPRYVFLENVGALVVRGLDTVLGDLAALGFDAEWCCLRASAVGAPHRRERVFILAHAHEHGRQGERGAGVQHGEWQAFGNDADRCRSEAADVGNAAGPRCSGRQDAGAGGGDASQRARSGEPERAGADVGNPTRHGRVEGRPESARVERRSDAAKHGGAVEHPERERLEGQQPARPAAWAAIGTGGVFPPGPGDHDGWRAILDHSPHLAPATEPGIRCVADGAPVVVDASRADQLRCIGNGVVPLQSAVAARLLLRRISGRSVAA